jgi:hypothetical protein
MTPETDWWAQAGGINNAQGPVAAHRESKPQISRLGVDQILNADYAMGIEDYPSEQKIPKQTSPTTKERNHSRALNLK